jgi:hypothetical protein
VLIRYEKLRTHIHVPHDVTLLICLIYNAVLIRTVQVTCYQLISGTYFHFAAGTRT